MAIVIWTKPDCVWCDKISQFLADRNTPFTKINVMGDDATHIRGLMRVTGMDTVPRIWNNGLLLGGYEEAVEWFKNHES